jgi:hypothetical protein
MQVRTGFKEASCNIWTSHGTWFWLLIRGDRHAGAIGAATTQAEAIREALAAAKTLPDIGDAGCIEMAPPAVSRSAQTENSVAAAPKPTACAKPCSPTRSLRRNYENVWSAVLCQYAAFAAMT